MQASGFIKSEDPNPATSCWNYFTTCVHAMNIAFLSMPPKLLDSGNSVIIKENF